MKPIYLDWHLGLGDAIICNGLVRWLARERDVVIPCYPHNFASVELMFSDLDNVQVDSLSGSPDQYDDLDQEGCDIISIGMNNPRWGEVQPFDGAFYEFAGVPFEAKWDLFHIPESPTEIAPPDYRFALLHEDRSRGFQIDRTRIKDILIHSVQPRTPRLSDWRLMLSAAAEVHVIDSSMLHLAELLPTNGKLFYHRYARPAIERSVDSVLKKDWRILD